MRLTILLDTNVVIPLEPTSPAEIEASSPRAFTVASLAQQVGGFLLHPAQIDDLQADKDQARRTLRLSLAVQTKGFGGRWCSTM